MTGHLDELVRSELARLAATLEPLDEQAWETPSLCDGWTIREVVAHVSLAARRSSPAVVAGLALTGFRWHRYADRVARRDAKLPVSTLLADLRSDRLAAWRPPGGGAEGALVHAFVHALDVTIPLRTRQSPDPDRARPVLDALVAPASLKHFGVDVTGLELHADDAAWSHGAGQPVSASSDQLVLALSGRAPLPA